MTPPAPRGGAGAPRGGSGKRGGAGRRGGTPAAGGPGKPGGSGKSGGSVQGGGSGKRGGAGRRGGTPAGPARGGGTGGTPGRRRGPQHAGTTKKSQPTRVPVEPTRAEVEIHDPDGIRLQKLLAACGIGSRRACEQLIVEGRVEVDGQIVTELGVRVDPTRQLIHVDGVRVQTDPDRVYLAFNKPLGVVSTMSDDLGRPCVGDYVAGRRERLFHVGRLDSDTEGLLLLTNDGELANRLAHPSYEVLKTYVAQIPGPVPRDLGKQLRAGVVLDDGPVTVDSFRLVDSFPGKAVVEVILHEGRNRVVRRLLESVGHPVISLARVQFGPVRLGSTKAGKVRALTAREVSELYDAVGL